MATSPLDLGFMDSVMGNIGKHRLLSLLSAYMEEPEVYLCRTV